MARRVAFHPDGRQALYEKHRYSAAVRSGDLLFVSGQVGARDDGSPEPDATAQVALAFERLEAVLDAAGCSFDDVLDVTIFLTDPAAQSAAIDAARRRAFGQAPYPSLTVVGVSYLSGFAVEIKVVARIPAPGEGARGETA